MPACSFAGMNWQRFSAVLPVRSRMSLLPTTRRGGAIWSRVAGAVVGLVRITRTKVPLETFEEAEEKALSYGAAQLLVQEYQRRHILAPQTAAVILAAVSDQALSPSTGGLACSGTGSDFALYAVSFTWPAEVKRRKFVWCVNTATHAWQPFIYKK